MKTSDFSQSVELVIISNCHPLPSELFLSKNFFKGKALNEVVQLLLPVSVSLSIHRIYLY